ncbi:MAG: PAS domain S-box protein [Gammaproteobacteria bacterium]
MGDKPGEGHTPVDSVAGWTTTPPHDGERRFQTLAECLPDDFFLHDEHGFFVDLNDRACLSLGYTRAELLRMNVDDISVARGRGEREQIWRGAQPDKVITLQSRHRRKDGSVFPVEVRVTCQQLGGRKLFFGVAHDISERVRAENTIQQLNQELERRVVERTRELADTTDALQAIMDSANDAIFLKDAEGRFLLFNRAAERFSGFAAADVIGKTAVETFGPETGGLMMAQERRVLVDGETFTVEETLSMSGNRRVFMATRSPRRNAAGAITGLVGVSRDITDRKIVENELRTQANRLKLAAQVGGLGIWDYHIDADTLYCDERWYQIIGRSAVPPIRSIEEFKSFIHPEDVARATEVDLAALADLTASNRNYSIVFRIVRPDGEIRWLRSAACLIEGNENTPMRAIGIVTDITESHLAAEKLQRSYQSLLEAERLARIGSWRLDLASRRFSCSDMLYELNGADPAGPPLTPSDISKLFTHEEQQLVSAAIARCASTGEPFELTVQHLRLDGAPFPAHLRGQANRDSSGTIVALSGTVQDITEREEARARLGALADNLPSGAIFLLEQREGQRLPVLTYISAAIERLIGFAASDLIAHRETLRQILFEEDRARFDDTLAAAARALAVFDCRFRVHTSAGRVIWMHVRAAPRLQSKGSAAWDGIIRDVTLDHEAAEALRQAKEAAEAAEQIKSDFLATMSHELRTPLSAVMGMTRLALRTELSDSQRHYLERIDASARRLLDILNDVLDLSKIEAGRLDLEEIPFTLESVLDSVTNISGVAAEEKHLEIVYAISASVPRELRGDPLRLSQILTNLVSNAVKFTEQGEIVVAVDLVTHRPEHRVLQFSVRDTGIGLTADQLAGLFQPFSQGEAGTSRRYGGTGLGLAICKRLVEKMDGRIWAESSPGSGSTFHFTVVLRALDEARQQGAAKVLSPWRVLIVDDNASARTALAQMSACLGMRAEVASSGEQALEILHEALAQGTGFDLLLIDRRMPGMDGLQIARRIRGDARLSRLPAVMMVTAYGRDETSRQIERIGVQGLLVKPATESVLRKAISAVLEGPPRLQAAAASSADDSGAGPVKWPALSGRRVLVVDDQALNREVVTELLRLVGMKIDTAGSGAEAVDRVRHTRYDAVLMDLNMPGMSGIEAVRQMRAEAGPGRPPVIALTAQVRVEDVAASRDAGMGAHLAKPIDETLLYRTLSEIIARAVPHPRVPPASDGQTL